MSGLDELEVNGYLTCVKCNAVNRVREIGQQGVYNCGECKQPLIVINKEKKEFSWGKFLVISFFVGIAGNLSYDKIKEELAPRKAIYTKLETTWSKQQVEHFELKCKANFSKVKMNWSIEKIEKTCTCLTTYIVERSDYPLYGKFNVNLIESGAKECKL